jgi:DNA-binding CsgD family transcriptional regulator
MGVEIESQKTPAPLRVAVLSADPEQQAALTALVRGTTHSLGGLTDADAVLTDGSLPLPEGVPAVILGESNSAAAGVLSNRVDAVQIDAALRAVAVGLTVRQREADAPHFASFEEREPEALLTPREIEVLIALSEGMSNKAVARRLDISQHTVKFHVESIFRKLGVTTRAEAVAKGLRQGIVHF